MIMDDDEDKGSGESQASTPPERPPFGSYAYQQWLDAKTRKTLPEGMGRGKDWISLRQFAALMEVTYHTALKWKKRKKFRWIEVGSEVRITEQEVRYCLESGTRPDGTGGTPQDLANAGINPET